MTVIHGLIPAGGVGARALSAQSVSAPSLSSVPTQPLPKQYRLVNGVPMLVHAVNALLADGRVQDVAVGVQTDDPFAHEYLSALARVQVWPTAGATRALTVLQTLQQVGFADLDWVLVHDAARPGLPNDCLTALIDACLQANQGGLLAMPAADTVKLAREQPTVNDACASEVESTLDRGRIWLAQTPQMFKVGELKAALSGALKAGVEVTDEASAMEWAGHAPLLVPGSVRNFKVTWPEDFERLGELS
ncbi:MAG TPA: 2-C-methyl-D-erythritol 4-phosphate cytidylyltransferase [Orrella sp.]